MNPLGLTIVRFRADQAFSQGFIDPPRGLFMSFHATNPAFREQIAASESSTTP